MEILSLRAAICCQGETKASPFDKLAVVTVRRKGKKKHLGDRYWKMVIQQGLVNWLGNKLMTLSSFCLRDIFMHKEYGLLGTVILELWPKYVP